MITIGRVAKSLLDVIGAQNFGEAPRTFSDTVVPIVDVTPMYVCNTVLIDGATSAAGFADGVFNAVARTPVGTLRYYHDISLVLTLLAAQVGMARIAAQVQGNTNPALRIGLSELVGVNTAPAAENNYATSRHFGPPMLMPAGIEVGWEIFTAVPATATLTMGLHYSDWKAGG